MTAAAVSGFLTLPSRRLVQMVINLTRICQRVILMILLSLANRYKGKSMQLQPLHLSFQHETTCGCE